jgi:hypothetical protein
VGTPEVDAVESVVVESVVVEGAESVAGAVPGTAELSGILLVCC